LSQGVGLKLSFGVVTLAVDVTMTGETVDTRNNDAGDGDANNVDTGDVDA
jgi:hypothetical protein